MHDIDSISSNISFLANKLFYLLSHKIEQLNVMKHGSDPQPLAQSIMRFRGYQYLSYFAVEELKNIYFLTVYILQQMTSRKFFFEKDYRLFLFFNVSAFYISGCFHTAWSIVCQQASASLCAIIILAF